MVMEQGEYLPATTFCVECGLTSYELLQDALLRSTEMASAQGVASDSGDEAANSSAQDAGSSSTAPISDEQYAVQGMNLMFSGVGLDLDHRVEG